MNVFLLSPNLQEIKKWILEWSISKMERNWRKRRKLFTGIIICHVSKRDNLNV